MAAQGTNSPPHNRCILWVALGATLLTQLVNSAETRSISFEQIGETNQNETPRHYSWLGSYSKNARFSLDIASRVIRNEGAGVTAYANFIGLDFHKVLSNADGDWGTIALQPYLTRIDNMGGHAPFFESANDWELVPRVFNFNYTALAQGKFNIRVGHMEVPFGLEHVVNTNGTIRDYMHGPNIGVKPDWGFSFNGNLKNLEYETALLRGTGIEYSSTGDPYLFATRIGTPRERPLSFGLSFYQGDIQRLSLPDHTLSRIRTGIDAIWEVGAFSLMGEISAGDDEGVNILNSVMEIDWHSQSEIWMIFAQVQNFEKEIAGNWDAASTANIGIRYAPDSHWNLSFMWKKGLATHGTAPEANVLISQVRFRL